MGVALGHSHPMMTRSYLVRRRAGMTLIELLVVVGVVVLVLSIALPVVGHIWEAAKRSKCESNLKEIGMASMMFARDHEGYFPVCYRMRNTTLQYPYYIPFMISQGVTPADRPFVGGGDLYSNDSLDVVWKVYGTSWSSWRQYLGHKDDPTGALKIWTCPSTNGNGALLQDLTATNPEYGAIVWTNYAYVGGISTASLQQNLYNFGAPAGNPPYTYRSQDHWGIAMPAVKASASEAQIGGAMYTGNTPKASTVIEVQTQTYVLAADLCFYSGGKGSMWYNFNATPTDHSNSFRINHMRLGTVPTKCMDGSIIDGFVPDFQNILYSDGSVRAHGVEDYFQPLNIDPANGHGDGTLADTGPNWSMQISNGPGIGGYIYWGPREAVPLPLATVPIPATEPGTFKWTGKDPGVPIVLPAWLPPQPPSVAPMPPVLFQN